MIAHFIEFLRGLDGRRKSEGESLQVATDVSKYLKFASPSSTNPNWLDLLDVKKARKYIDMLSSSGACGASGQLMKLDRMLYGLRFIRLELAGENAALSHRCNTMEERLAQWKAAIRPEKLQEASASSNCEVITLQEATTVIRDRQIRLHVQAAISRVKVEGEEVDDEDMKLVLAYLFCLLAYHSWQRPGAVTNATLNEYEAMKEERGRDGVTVHVMRVARHKTAREGPAHITITAEDKKLLDRYVQYIRPRCDPYCEVRTVFVTVRGEPVTNMNQLLQWLAVKYGVRVPSCMTLCTVAATACAADLEPKDRLLICSQMGHSEQVHRKYYEKLQTTQQAATAFMLRQRMIEDEESSTNKVEPPKQAPKAKQAPKVRHRREYNERELSLIKRWIKEDLKDRPSATLAECRSFLKRHPMERTAKNIQDKVAQLQRKL